MYSRLKLQWLCHIYKEIIASPYLFLCPQLWVWAYPSIHPSVCPSKQMGIYSVYMAYNYMSWVHAVYSI